MEERRNRKVEKMTAKCPTRRESTAWRPSRVPSARLHATKRPALGRSMRAGALCALVCLANSVLVAQTEASATGVGPFAPGSVVVSQGGTIFGGTNTGTGVELNGDVDVYPPNSNGDVPPEASFTNGMYGPTTMVFDSGGDLWVANENTSDLFELTKAQLGTPNPVPAVTIFAESGALANPFGMAFDSSGNLWVVSNAWNKVYEYTKSELAASGGPTPVTTISDFPSTPIFGDAFDASGDLWVSTVKSVVEFSKAELATTDPVPTRHDLFERRRPTCLRRLGGPVDGHRRRAGLLRHPLYQRGGGVHQGPALHIGFPHACRHDQLNRAWQPHRVPVRPLLARVHLLG